MRVHGIVYSTFEGTRSGDKVLSIWDSNDGSMLA